MTDLVSINGEIVSAEGKLNRAMLFGDGFFESFRLNSTGIIFRDQHRSRIEKACRILRFSEQGLFEQIEHSALELLNAQPEGAFRGRVTIYRKGTGLYMPEDNSVEYILQLFPIDSKEFVLNKQGLLIDIYTGIQKQPNLLSSLKTLNALPFVLASIEKKERELDELLILNTQNRICEAISSNVFAIRGDKIFTPSANEGCVEGVMRRVVLDHAADIGFVVNETSVTTLDLLECDELFLTNAARGIQWIVGFRNKRYFNKSALRLTEMLNSLVQ